jgi:hypothetical protein
MEVVMADLLIAAGNKKAPERRMDWRNRGCHSQKEKPFDTQGAEGPSWPHKTRTSQARALFGL